jgi:hypothetical protein
MLLTDEIKTLKKNKAAGISEFIKMKMADDKELIEYCKSFLNKY